MENILIRKADKKDLDEVFRLINILENKTFDRKKFEDCFLDVLNNKNIQCFVASIEDKIIGFSSVSIFNQLHHCGKVAEILELVVDENYRNKNIGKSFIDFIKKFAEENKSTTIDVASNKTRINAHRFYEREGFKSSHFKFTLDLDAKQ